MQLVFRKKLDLFCTLVKYISATISLKHNPDDSTLIQCNIGGYKTAYYWFVRSYEGYCSTSSIQEGPCAAN